MNTELQRETTLAERRAYVNVLETMVDDVKYHTTELTVTTMLREYMNTLMTKIENCDYDLQHMATEGEQADE